ncbi:MAG: 23S rRNA (adenine(2503)-C(2))-methyltransferase RlmN [Deltaproteobacteria bacterium]|nr:23S rRNA (adenine(2503)-C(2))-methyltransferase RlmN [Deltaproteobacteria bacterium]
MTASTAAPETIQKPHKHHILGLRKSDLVEELLSIGVPEKKARYHSRQIFHWLYQRKVTTFEMMTDLSKLVRGHLAEKFQIAPLPKVFHQKSIDGTQKFLFRLYDGKTIESVLIPAEDRLTICISSQVGCAMGCKFCLTGTMGLMRNLEVYEIVGQVLELSKLETISNIVFMGMGEPLHNLENVCRAIEILLAQDALNFSKRKVTVSTSGLVSAIRKMNDRLVGESRPNLAISLNGSYDAQREEVMPVNKAFPIADLLEACRDWHLEPHRRITFEYVVLGGLNDTVEDAARVTKLLRGIPCKVNLIPYNPHDGSDYKRPEHEAVLAMHRYLLDHDIAAMIRHSRGRDILAACGQLRSAVDAVARTRPHIAIADCNDGRVIGA